MLSIKFHSLIYQLLTSPMNICTLRFRRNPTIGQVIAIDDPNSVSGSAWNASTPTIMVTHGWRSTGDKASCSLVRDGNVNEFLSLILNRNFLDK